MDKIDYLYFIICLIGLSIAFLYLAPTDAAASNRTKIFCQYDEFKIVITKMSIKHGNVQYIDLYSTDPKAHCKSN